MATIDRWPRAKVPIRHIHPSTSETNDHPKASIGDRTPKRPCVVRWVRGGPLVLSIAKEIRRRSRGPKSWGRRPRVLE